MMKRIGWGCSAIAALGLVAAQSAQDAKELQRSLKDTGVHASWVYNDPGAGFAEAKKTGKPVLVVFR